MKKNVCMVVLVICLMISLPAMADDEGVAARAQVKLTISHVFGDNEAVKGFATGALLYDIANDYPIAFGFGGAMITVGEVNIYPCLVLMGEPTGMSVGPSIWLEGYGFFLEYDHNESWLPSQHGESAPPASYYGFAEYGYGFKDKVTLGVAGEVVGFYEDEDPFQLAYGPYVQFDRFRVWVAYDETPTVPGNDYWIFRFKFGF